MKRTSGPDASRVKSGQAGLFEKKAASGKVLLIDKPGVENKTEFPSGKFRFCPEDATAWGVDIWE